jgi:GT2 family glycosyltransferase
MSDFMALVEAAARPPFPFATTVRLSSWSRRLVEPLMTENRDAGSGACSLADPECAFSAACPIEPVSSEDAGVEGAGHTHSDRPVLSVVVVCYGGEDLLRTCLRSIPARTGEKSVETIVVDNASPDGTPDMVEREFPDMRLIRGEENLGFAAGNNRALRISRGDYIMLLNPDAEIVPGTVEVCIDYLDAHASVSVVAPRILNPDGTLQFSLRNFPTAANAIFEALLLHRLLPALTSRMAETVIDPGYYEQEKAVEWASGAAFIARASTFAEIGGLDERYFLYSEETDWFTRLAEHGLDVVYLPNAVVIHRSSDGRSPDLMCYSVTSRLLYAQTHLSRSSAALVRVVLGLGMLARLAAWSLIAVSGRDGARSRSRSYWVGLRTALRRQGACRD